MLFWRFSIQTISISPQTLLVCDNVCTSCFLCNCQGHLLVFAFVVCAVSNPVFLVYLLIQLVLCVLLVSFMLMYHLSQVVVFVVKKIACNCDLWLFSFSHFFVLFCFGRPRLRRLRIIRKWRLIIDVEVGAGAVLGVLLLMQVDISFVSTWEYYQMVMLRRNGCHAECNVGLYEVMLVD